MKGGGRRTAGECALNVTITGPGTDPVTASAANLFGLPQASSDCLAVPGDNAPLRDLKFMFDYYLVLGITAGLLGPVRMCRRA